LKSKVSYCTKARVYLLEYKIKFVGSNNVGLYDTDREHLVNLDCESNTNTNNIILTCIQYMMMMMMMCN